MLSCQERVPRTLFATSSQLFCVFRTIDIFRGEPFSGILILFSFSPASAPSGVPLPCPDRIYANLNSEE